MQVLHLRHVLQTDNQQGVLEKMEFENTYLSIFSLGMSVPRDFGLRVFCF